MDPVNTFHKNFDHFVVRCPSAGTKGKITRTQVKRMSSNLSRSNLMCSHFHVLNQLHAINGIEVLF